MEVGGVGIGKRSRNRKRKRHSKNKRREQVKSKVRFWEHRKVIAEKNAFFSAKEKIRTKTMQTNTFWENYEVAQNWQQRHSVAWWRSRCVALEHENGILREKIRTLVQGEHINPSFNGLNEEHSWRRNSNESADSEVNNEREDIHEESISDDDELEFQLDEDMKKFFEQSMRHKMELKQKRESESAAKQIELEDVPLEGGAAWVRARTEGAKLLYGEASSRILAMETALQATVDRHKDKAKPQYWPNIPLKL